MDRSRNDVMSFGDYQRRIEHDADNLASVNDAEAAQALKTYGVDLLKRFIMQKYGVIGFKFKVANPMQAIDSVVYEKLLKISLGSLHCAVISGVSQTTKPVVSPFNVLTMCRVYGIETFTSLGAGAQNIDGVGDLVFEETDDKMRFVKGDVDVVAPIRGGLINTDFIEKYFPEFTFLPFDESQLKIAALFGFFCRIKNGKIEVYSTYDSAIKSVGMQAQFFGKEITNTMTGLAVPAGALLYSTLSPVGTWELVNASGAEFAHHMYKALTTGDEARADQLLKVMSSMSSGISSTRSGDHMVKWLSFDGKFLSINPPDQLELPQVIGDSSCQLKPSGGRPLSCSLEQARRVLQTTRGFAGCNDESASGLIRGQMTGMFLDPTIADIMVEAAEFEPYKDRSAIYIRYEDQKFPLIEMQALLALDYAGTVWIAPGTQNSVKLKAMTDENTYKFGDSKYTVKMSSYELLINKDHKDLVVFDNRRMHFQYARNRAREYHGDITGALKIKLEEYALHANVTFVTRSDVVDNLHAVVEKGKGYVYTSARPHNLVVWIVVGGVLPELKQRIIFNDLKQYMDYYAFATVCNLVRLQAPVYCLQSRAMLDALGYDAYLPTVRIRGIKLINSKVLLYDQISMAGGSASNARLRSAMDAHNVAMGKVENPYVAGSDEPVKLDRYINGIRQDSDVGAASVSMGSTVKRRVIKGEDD